MLPTIYLILLTVTKTGISEQSITVTKFDFSTLAACEAARVKLEEKMKESNVYIANFCTSS